MSKKANSLSYYVMEKPENQHVLDIFKGEWSSRLPEGSALETQPGFAQLFDDARVNWAEETFGGFDNWNILELGPLEAGHSYMFQKRGAKKVLAIEANTRAFLKCLCIKEIFNLDRVSFILGDFEKYLETDTAVYDMVFASGVLYHMSNPVSLLEHISRVSDRLFLWTHYYDKEIIRNNKTLRRKFGDLQELVQKGETYHYAQQYYKSSLDWAGFCGGLNPTSIWLTRESIIKALTNFGFEINAIGFDHPDHQNGPSFAICAQKTKK